MEKTKSEILKKIRSGITPIPASLCGRISRGYVSMIINGGSIDRVEFINGNIQIGWHKHHVTHWIKNYKNILNNMDYNKETINEYYEYIKFCYERYLKSMGLKSAIN